MMVAVNVDDIIIILMTLLLILLIFSYAKIGHQIVTNIISVNNIDAVYFIYFFTFLI